MITLFEYAVQYPEYTFDLALPIRDQPRVHEQQILDELPQELQAAFPYTKGGRGRPNRNQTRTHSQCGSCHRVLRNDMFYTPPSMVAQNLVFTHCKSCAQNLNAERYEIHADEYRLRRMAIWNYLAPACAVCSFNRHASAMDMHHVNAGSKENAISKLVADLASSPNIQKAETLLREASQCIPVCSNCHRMLHAQALALPANAMPSQYSLARILSLLN